MSIQLCVSACAFVSGRLVHMCECAVEARGKLQVRLFRRDLPCICETGLLSVGDSSWPVSHKNLPVHGS